MPYLFFAMWDVEFPFLLGSRTTVVLTLSFLFLLFYSGCTLDDKFHASYLRLVMNSYESLHFSFPVEYKYKLVFY